MHARIVPPEGSRSRSVRGMLGSDAYSEFYFFVIFVEHDCFGRRRVLRPKAPQDQLAEAQQKLQHGQPAAAIALLQPLANATPPVKGAAHELGVAYYRTGKLTDALQAFTQAEKEDPNDMESVQLHGLTLYRLGRPADAIPYLQRVRQWMPNADADANHVLGLCYLNAQTI